MNTIRSSRNWRVRRLKKLHTRRHREQEGCFILEGLRLIADTPREFLEEVFVSETADSGDTHLLLDGLLRDGIRVFRLDPLLFDELAGTVNPQGILALARMPKASPSTFWKDVHGLVVCDAIQDPGNLGTLFRTAAGAGYDGVIVTDGTVDPYNAKSVRASMGSLFRIPHCALPAANAVAALNQRGFRILVGDAQATKPFYEVDMKGDVALVLGNEGSGPRSCFRQNASDRISIPLANELESLNVTAAAGILLFERVRQIRQSRT